ncbi:ABC transporter ATP-binding protein [Streptococcus oralis]|uniref:Amino acid ABC transporter ATP-binding protein n=2 Tax=Streptococcus oralis TaxID=1303 RepID=A0A0F2DRV0_STROR|nr:ABC transporter ATP-binding protein [Streptococcus oralis]KEQ44409.1 bacteriocin export ABC transporter, lactococcin 972 group family protein [Streptococcus oralis]KJQ64527.1 amino acid ABC transporter ATP-binding protein [Streptococcus oralis subsp. oralis]KJQ72311.1 amino acid ABC transporter ATP-binding protein [Streptococcus oralis subsp. oralis]MBZ2077494.1 ABC transporter ATP-binding protein [Streptococcus oralis]QPS97461.1 ABC transporter ATP-binding protein [Streptococcus oralis]
MIKLENVTKTIGKKVILENLSLKINQGDLVAIVGKSGSGKSTLLNLLGLIDGDYSGHYEIFGQQNVPVNSVKSQAIIREHISYLFQNFALIDNETVEYNLMLALKYVKLSKKDKVKKIEEILERVGLPSTLHQKVSELSGGEQQRIAVARAILKPSQLLLADEPTGSLDPENRDLVLNFLLDMNKEGKTVIIVTHDAYVAEQCHRVIEL